MKKNKRNLIVKPYEDIQQMMMDIASGKIIIKRRGKHVRHNETNS
tara:strand:+ start:1782 stop:1916 length:135 start_codon:yes stop_codon:yes gene_type:complete